MKCISDQVAGLTELSRPELVELWIKAHKGPPPKGIGRRLTGTLSRLCRSSQDLWGH